MLFAYALTIKVLRYIKLRRTQLNECMRFSRLSVNSFSQRERTWVDRRAGYLSSGVSFPTLSTYTDDWHDEEEETFKAAVKCLD
jgi:hypothetical protein